MVKEGHIQWDTQFFELYPELLRQSHPAYENMTLQDLLTMRVPLMKWSYGNNTPTKKEIKGNPQEQRYAFVAWILQQDPVAETSTVYWSNPAYVAAGLMLEKASGKSYETLVETFGLELGILFGFGQPNDAHKLQPWGHDNNLQAEPPGANYQLNWLSAAGNINVSLPGYTIFVQLQLRGLQGKFARFTAEEFDYLHYGLPECSFGWKWYVDESTQWKYSYHDGNPGTFLSKTVICKDTDKAFIIFTNVQSPEAEEGMKVLLEELKRRYNHV